MPLYYTRKKFIYITLLGDVQKKKLNYNYIRKGLSILKRSEDYEKN